MIVDTVDRSKTAIRRVSCSRPIALALADGLISQQTSVFDYGCGHGSDVRFLSSCRIKASGWDPHYHPLNKLKNADVVNLGYVLNVIEDPKERAETLLRAFALANQLFIVSVRVDDSINETTEFGDGVLTRRGTFQKIYGQKEFREYIEETLSRRVHLASVGVAYVFKNEDLEARYLANRAFTRRLEYRTDLIEEFSKNKVARSFVRLANDLGRVPLPEEFPKYSKLLDNFGSPKRIERLTLQHINQEVFEGSRAQRKEDILTFIAMLRLERLKPPRLSLLPLSVQKDIKEIWKNYESALVEGTAFLFSLGEPKKVAAACRESSVGKLLPEDLYVHRTAEDDLPALLRIVVFAAQRIVGDLPYDLVKISIDGRKVSFLSYPNFDTDPHPRLAKAVKVYLPKADYVVRDYQMSPNPPILHRKETFVSRSYPYYEQFKQLTEQEEQLELLSSNTIGLQLGWEAMLRAKGVRLEGHQIVKASSDVA